MATGAVTGLVSLFAARFVLGMGEGATLPAANRAISNWTSPPTRGTAVGITHAAGRLGAGASAPIVAFLIVWFSWRFSFVVLGILSAFWAVLWWRYFHEDPRQHPRSLWSSWRRYRLPKQGGRSCPGRCRGDASSLA
jgi:MFS family permease